MDFIRLIEPRIPPLSLEELNGLEGAYRELLEKTKERFNDRIPNIFLTLARHIKLLKRWLAFGNHILVKSTLPPRDRELLILRIGWLCYSEYEWGQHAMIGKQCGLKEEEINRIPLGPNADGWEPFDSALLRAVDELYGESFISNKTWQVISERYTTQQLMDLIFTVGQYNMISMFLNTAGVQLENGINGFPENN